VSLNYVNEVAVNASSSSAANTGNSSGDTSVVDLIEEELAKMAEAESLGDLEAEDDVESQDDEQRQKELPESSQQQRQEAVVDENTVIINLNSSRISIPGTPTSVVSIRSSQDSSSTSSSSSSTKLLLTSHLQQQQPIVSVGSAVIVKVHPAKDSRSGEEDNES
jgi:hypothetical protein